MSALVTTRRAMLGAGLAFPFVARARGFPERPIRYLCPFPPGAINDNASRTRARALHPRLSQPIVVENRANARSTVGARAVAEPKSDGHALLNVAAGNLTFAPHLDNVGHDPLRACPLSAWPASPMPIRTSSRAAWRSVPRSPGRW